MKCWEILSAIFTDIGLQLRGDILPELPTVPTFIEKSKSPITDTRRKTNGWRGSRNLVTVANSLFGCDL